MNLADITAARATRSAAVEQPPGLWAHVVPPEPAMPPAPPPVLPPGEPSIGDPLPQTDPAPPAPVSPPPSQSLRRARSAMALH